jgi:hypothetical protein
LPSYSFLTSDLSPGPEGGLTQSCTGMSADPNASRKQVARTRACYWFSALALVASAFPGANGQSCSVGQAKSASKVALSTESIVATSCVSYNSASTTIDGSTGNPSRATGSNCGNVQSLVYDMGSAYTMARIDYLHCAPPGFTNGHVKDFKVWASSSELGPWTEVLSGQTSESEAQGTRVPFRFSSSPSARYWKWDALSNWGNGAYIWTCELEFYACENCAAGTYGTLASESARAGWTLFDSYLDHTNGGSGKWTQCGALCLADSNCRSWMGRNSGNTCYHSTNPALRLINSDNTNYGDHHPASVVQACVACPAAKYQANAGQSACSACEGMACPAGRYISGCGGATGGTCASCPVGKYSGTASSSSCASCPSGKYSAAAASGSCSTCPSGKFCDSGAGSCSSCPGGKFSADVSASGCGNCPSSKFSSDAATSCSSCAGGRYSGASSSSCTSCPSGKYSLAAASGCTACPVGQIGKGTEKTTLEDGCEPCAAGRYSSTGETDCGGLADNRTRLIPPPPTPLTSHHPSPAPTPAPTPHMPPHRARHPRPHPRRIH